MQPGSCVSPLAFRRRHPTAVAVLALAATTVALGAGIAALVALFNAAVRSSPRALAWIFALSLVSNAIYPLLYPDADIGGYWGHNVDWTTAAMDYQLERTNTIAGTPAPQWVPVVPTPRITDSRLRVTNNIGPDSPRFYRLRKP